MKPRWQLSLLLTLSLLWQGLAAAAVVPMWPVPAAAAEAAQPATAADEAAHASPMPEHCRMAGMHHGMHSGIHTGMQAKAKTETLTTAPVKAASAQSKTMSCCDPGSHCAGHCFCAMAAGSLSGLPMSAALLSLPPPALLRSGFAQPPPGDLPPLDPLRPPISVVL